MSQEVELREPHLWWVVDGRLHLRIHGPGQNSGQNSGQNAGQNAGGVTGQNSGQNVGGATGTRHLRLRTGQAVLVAPSRGGSGSSGTSRASATRVSVLREPGTVAFGFRTGEDAPPPVDPAVPGTVIDIPDERRELLIERFADSLNYLRSRTPGMTVDHPGQPPSPLTLPPVPVDPAARSVARLILADPAGAPGVPGLADAAFISPATLNRRFREQTGLPVAAWRTRVRLVVAVTHLRTPGATLEAAAHRAGLSSASALCHLVRRLTGMTPDRCRTMVGDATPPDPAARSTWPRTNRLHILVWAWRGGCRATAGGRTVTVDEGDLVWLPAGLPNHVTTDRGGLILPVGARAGRAPHLDGPVAVAGHDRGVLLDAVGREYDPVAPERTATVDRLFYSLLAAGNDADAAVGDRPLRKSHLVIRLLEEFRRCPSVTRTAAQWAGVLDCTVGELTEALTAFGITDLRVWHGHVRMVAARRLLASGIPVGAVATYLGYSSTASFSHVFRRAHGVPPSAWDAPV